MKDKKDIIRPVILQVGFVLAISFAGFLYSRLKSKRTKFCQPPNSMCPSDHFVKADVEGRTTMKKTSISESEDSISVDKHVSTSLHSDKEDTFRPKVIVDDIVAVVSPNSRNNGYRDGCPLREFADDVEEYDTNYTDDLASLKKELETSRSDFETLQALRSKEKEEYEQEIRYLRAMIGDLQEREKNLEFQLLEFYGLKEQESALLELQNRLELINNENKIFTLKMESLQEENHRLEEQLASQAKIVSELDAARMKIKLLKKMLKSEAAQNKLQILKLRERVIKLQEQEAAGIGSDMQLTLEKLKDLEAEVEDLKKANFKLQQENDKLARKANSAIEGPETVALLSNQTKQEKEELEKKVEQLQADRCTDVEELVYLRWINACLRFEMRNFKPEYGKTVARDLSRSLSPESEAKAKQLILEYAYTDGTEKGMDFNSDMWSSPHNSYILDSDELSVSSKDLNSSKVKFFNKLRRLVRGKDRTEDYDFGTLSSSSMSSVSPDLNGVSFRQSMGMSKLKNMDETKESEFRQRCSDIGSGSICDHKRAFSARITSTFMSPENQIDKGDYASETSELKKFAEVLKNSENGTRKVHRKSTSLGSLLGIRSSASE